MPLVGACLATGDRIFATGRDTDSKCVLRSCACFCLISGRVKRAQKPKMFCDSSSFAILSFTPILTVRSAVWRQDLAILSSEGPHDST